MTTTTEAGATAPAPGRRVTPTGRLILPATAPREAWLTARRSGLGSSDIAAILGIGYRSNALGVYHDKIGSLPLESDDSEPAYWGRSNEEGVARRWAASNRSVAHRVGLVANIDRPWQMCTLDRRVLECPLAPGAREKCALEVKCRDKMKAPMWRRGCPDDVLAQVLHQIDVCGFDHLHVATLIGGNDYRQFTVWRKDYEDLIGDLRMAGAVMWEHVTARRPPTLTGAEEPGPLIDLYQRLHPDRDGYIEIGRDGDAQDALAEYIAAGAMESAGKKAKERAKAKLLGHLGKAEVALRGDSVAFSYDASSREWCDTKRLSERWPDAYADTVEDRPQRRINIPKHIREEHLS
jgi:putative phage-type endonuclease